MGFKQARIRANKKVSEAAKHMGVSTEAVYQWESGVTMPNGKKLAKLAGFYGCSVDELLRKE